MKNFLAVDTSGNHLAVVAAKDGKTYSTYIENCAMKHAVSVMQAVEETLDKAGLTLAECGFFGAVVGAGSFTGIRIGISAVKGFCLALGKPSLPITSFDVLAYNAIDTQGKVLCLVDALHDCYYACGYEKGKITYDPTYLTEEEVLALAEKGYSLRGVGDLPIGDKIQVEKADPVQGLVNAAVALAERNAFGELTALYVRKSSAELNAEGKK
ncbi:MAG: tRNA (adenosine(37)-N6)-threonylcarbamoyltransferase complex dimerization subunit type 1 TsaB [Clostridia bacterium]|nr:tRNA (adenosine(37)-N6)-threonylcarbamoyltransferase complex dimerization subunit type 1 TsaB [Clostridia bacterium]